MRQSGILMHITSLPSPYGIGTMGKQAYAFVDFLQELAMYAFLPVARKADDITPFYPEGTEHPLEVYSAILMHLERKGLVNIDYSAPIGNYPAELYAAWPVHGSVALTQKGQEVVETLSINGIS